MQLRMGGYRALFAASVFSILTWVSLIETSVLVLGRILSVFRINILILKIDTPVLKPGIEFLKKLFPALTGGVRDLQAVREAGSALVQTPAGTAADAVERTSF